MRKLLGFAENGFLVLDLVLFTGGPLSLLRGDDPGDPVKQAIWLGIYTVTLFLIALHWKKVIRAIARNKLIWILVGIVLVSVLWSAAPEATLRRSILFLGSTLFGVYLAARYTLSEQLRLLSWAFGIAVLLSLIFALALPSYGITPEGPNVGTWRGIYFTKNQLGRVMVLSSIVFLLHALSGCKWRWAAWSGFYLSAILILLSKSKTSLVVLLALLALLPICKTLRVRNIIAIIVPLNIVLLSGSLALLFLSDLETSLSLIGRDATLTGRTELWSLVLAKIWERPWLGYGYSGFWQGPTSEAGQYVWSAIGWDAPHAHNGLLDLWIDLGLLGLIIYVLIFSLNFIQAINWVRATKTAENYFPLVYLVFIFLANLTESNLLVQNDIIWILYVMISSSLFVPIHKPSKSIVY